MIDDLRSIFEDDQQDEHRREARRFAEALAGDVIAYHDALQQAGIAGELLDDLTRHFSAAWLPQLNDEPVFDMSAFLGGETDV